MPVFGACGELLDALAVLLEDDLAPDVDARRLGPAAVDVADVDLVVDVEVLEQVEEEQRHVGVGAGGHVRHRGHAADARVDLAEVELAGVDVGEVVDLQEAAVALDREPVAELLGQHAGALAMLGRQRLGEDVVAAPAALVRRQLRMAGEVGHQRADDRAVAREHGLDRRGAVVDPLHDLELLVGHVLGVLVPVALPADEERGLAGVAVGRLHDEVVAEAGGRRPAPSAPRRSSRARACSARSARPPRCRAAW